MPAGVDMMLVTTLDDIAWMLNLRGNDIEYNPLFFSYVIFHKTGEDYRVDLFVDADKVSDPKVQEHLKINNISVHGYDAVSDKLKEYAETLENKKISVDNN
jgi:Xaa-Pro aminopeptidase